MKNLPPLTAGIILNDKYRLETNITHGNSGEVWKAFDRGGERIVALKFVLRDPKQDEKRLQRVKSTFQVVHLLNHQYICPVYALEQDPIYGYYLVMKWLEGRTLSDIHRLNARQDGRLPTQLVPKLLECVADALDYAHKKGVIHGDLKPTNISVLVKKAKIADVSLIDFGLAREVQESLFQAAQQGYEPGGTIAYMPPNVWLGHPPNPRTDQYSLAVMAYELYSGHLPFAGPTFETLRAAIMHTPPVPIKGIPDSINQALIKALSKESTNRFHSCSEFIRALGPVASSSSHSSNTLDPLGAEGTANSSYSQRGGDARHSSHPGTFAGGVSSRRNNSQRSVGSLRVTSFLYRFFKSLFLSTPEPGITKIDVLAGRIGIPLFLLFLVVMFFLIRLPQHFLVPDDDWVEITSQNNGEIDTPDEGTWVEPGESPGQRHVLTIADVNFPLRWCPPGNFLMGSPEDESDRFPEEIEHEVTLSQGYWILETEVTLEMYRVITGKSTPGGRESIDAIPANTVSWKEVMEFCHYFRLQSQLQGFIIAIPSEAQWEYAARAGTTTPFAGPNLLDEMGWYKENSGNRKKTVRMKSPNTWGIFDMHGGVREWCNDWYGPYPNEPSVDPIASPDSNQVIIRGGSYSSDAFECRSAFRTKADPESYALDVGFRFVLVAAEQSEESLLFARPSEMLYNNVDAHASSSVKADTISVLSHDHDHVDSLRTTAGFFSEDADSLSLDLSTIPLTDASLKKMKGMKQLLSLNLQGGSSITDEGLAFLSELINLQMLHLGGCRRITSVGLAHLAKMTQLRVLDLNDCRGITDQGLAILQEMKQLQWCHLNNTPIGDVGLVYLKNLPHLQKIDLNGCLQITDAGLKLLSTFPQLQELSLAGCTQLTDTGFEQLASISSLTSINISGCQKITNTAVAELEKKLPNCTIER